MSTYYPSIRNATARLDVETRSPERGGGRVATLYVDGIHRASGFLTLAGTLSVFPPARPLPRKWQEAILIAIERR